MSVDSELVSGASLEAWQRLLRAHCVIARELDVELQSVHGMTLSDYDTLVQLRDCESETLKMSELSRRTMLTRSGMTRLVQGLERDGLVERRSCDSDARVSYAALTPHGHEVLQAARETHHAGIRRTFADHFTEEEAAQLAALLGQVPGALEGDMPCGGGA
ncbi:MAG: putative MarR-family transcriptional regulator [Thermoleophilia bacterium]|nr:putative MarR-family transcriptional regulator [Thermoleophilia bacterium]